MRYFLLTFLKYKKIPPPEYFYWMKYIKIDDFLGIKDFTQSDLYFASLNISLKRKLFF